MSYSFWNKDNKIKKKTHSSQENTISYDMLNFVFTGIFYDCFFALSVIQFYILHDEKIISQRHNSHHRCRNAFLIIVSKILHQLLGSI